MDSILFKKNGEPTPQMLTDRSSKKVWWKCSEGYVWNAIIHSRAGPKKCGGSMCVGKVKFSSQMRYAKILTFNKSDAPTVIEQTAYITTHKKIKNRKTD